MSKKFQLIYKKIDETRYGGNNASISNFEEEKRLFAPPRKYSMTGTKSYKV